MLAPLKMSNKRIFIGKDMWEKNHQKVFIKGQLKLLYNQLLGTILDCWAGAKGNMGQHLWNARSSSSQNS